MKRCAAAIATVLALACAESAYAAWEQPVGGASPINLSPTLESDGPSLATIGGVVYVAWAEEDGVNEELRVARLNASGTAWETVASDGFSPINVSSTETALYPSLTNVGGVPYVSWAEWDGTNYQIRVARLNSTGTAWEKVGQTSNPGAPINFNPNASALEPSLTSVGGVPYVAWMEYDATNYEIRVARLNPSGTGWQQVDSGTSPINQAPDRNADTPSLATVNGVPYVAWMELDGTNAEIRVARLNAAGISWEKVGQGSNPASPINQAPTRNASAPSLTEVAGVAHVGWLEEDGALVRKARVARLNAAGTAWEKVAQAANAGSPINVTSSQSARELGLAAIGSVPYVVWVEGDTVNGELHVARPDAAGTDWEEVAASASPINESASESAEAPGISSVGGVPYVTWTEPDGTNEEVRVSRLEPELISQSAAASETTAALSATWRTYGLPYPLGFDYGANLERSTSPTSATAGQDPVTIEQQASGLAGGSNYSVRPYATAGVAEPRVLGAVSSFTTTPAPLVPDTTPPETTITKDPDNKLEKTKAKYKFTSIRAELHLRLQVRQKKPKPCDAGKAKFKRLDDGKHKFRVYAVDAAGNADSSPAKDKFKVL